MITLVLGGARSGKSRVAEDLVARLSGPITYVATAHVDPADADHVARVAAHQARRDPSWVTVDAHGPALISALAATEGGMLVDSLGTWLSAHPDFVADVDGLVAALAARDGDTVVVSEEVGLGVHPSSEPGRRFRDALGELNTAVADVSELVLLVVAGRVLPLRRP